MDWQVLERSRRKRAWLALGFGLLLLFAGPRPLVAEDDLTGQLLVAAPDMSDPNFAHTVIYILRHDSGGALGLVINRPMGEVPLDRLLALLHGQAAGTENGSTENGSAENGGKSEAGDPLLVFSGGPVEPYRPFTLHSRDVMPDHSVPVDDDTAFNVEDDVLKALADHAAPKSMIFALGYCGWAEGQLESELDRGDWYVVASDPALVFGTEPDHLWERAVALFSTEL
jgi:putative transcriptional regulator